LAREKKTQSTSYRCHGFSFLSEIPLPLRASSEPCSQPWRIIRDQNDQPEDGLIKWVEPNPDSDGSIWLLTGHSPAGIHLNFPNRANFVIRRDDRIILAAPEPGVPDSTPGHLLMNSVMPRALASERHAMLHASVVDTPRGAMAFLGASGSGKTTIATALALRGLPLVAEDVVRLELTPDSVLCHPCPAPPHLYADSSEHLFPGRCQIVDVEAVKFSDRPVALEALVVIDSGFVPETAPPISLNPVEPRRAFERVMPALFRIKPYSNAQIRREFDFAAALASQFTFHGLSYPRVFASLPAVLDLLSHLPERRRANHSAAKAFR
jgi:hypothetical protein